MDTQEYIRILRQQIEKHNKLYREGKPQISDAEYDCKVSELRRLDPNNSWFKQAEPAPVNNSRKRKLPIPMKSLNKVKSLAEVKSWLKSMAIPETHGLVIMPKYDGISWLRDECNHVTYSRGGAENEGQDCTNHFMFAKHALSVSSAMPFHFTFGELVFSVKEWETNFVGKISDATGEKFKSPRNTVAGFINRDETTPLLRHAEFVRYGVGETDWQEYSTFSEVLSKLRAVYCGPNLAELIKVQDLSEELLADLFKKWRKLYYIDGLVIYLNDLQLWKTLGRQQTSGNPLYAIAYKHPDFTDSFETTVRGINWRVNKAGALKPVVNIEAVDTGDCTMENPTGYNAGWCRDHDIAIGARVLVTRSGGVIPKILETIEPKECKLPSACPSCGSPLMFDEKGIELCCTNRDCDGIKLAKIIHFLTIVGAENMGDETIGKIFATGKHTISDFLNLTANDLNHIEGFGDVITTQILEQMKKIKGGVDPATLMHSSDCFKGIGKVKAQQFLNNLDEQELQSFVEGNYCWVGARGITMLNLAEGYRHFMRFLKDTNLPIRFPVKAIPVGTKYQNCAVCFSGIRDAGLEKEIVAQGGVIASGVSKKTTYLIVKDADGASSKISKAHQLGIPILTIEQFKAL